MKYVPRGVETYDGDEGEEAIAVADADTSLGSAG